MTPNHLRTGLSTGPEHGEGLDVPDEGHYSYIRVTPLQSIFSYKNSTGPDGGSSGTPLTLAVLLAMLSVAVLILALALLISKVRRRQSLDATDMDVEMPTDPYLQAIMFPTERPVWHASLKQLLTKAGQKIMGKQQPHDTHIPEALRYQLKQIYVY